MRYDSETGLYYLNSRYYDPQTYRFLNADSILDNRGINTLNLFAHCGNNSINNKDPDGHFFFGTLIGGMIGGKGNSTKHLMNLGKQSVKRPYNAVVHKGLKAAAKEGFSAAKYYCKNTVSYYSRYFGHDIWLDTANEIANTFVTSDYMKSQYQRAILG